MSTESRLRAKKRTAETAAAKVSQVVGEAQTRGAKVADSKAAKKPKTPEKAKTDQLLIRFAEADTRERVSRGTLSALATKLDQNETRVVHIALKRLADELLPWYEADDGPLTDAQMEHLRTYTPQDHTEDEVLSSL